MMKLKANKTSTKVSRRKKKGPNEKQNIQEIAIKELN